MLIRDYLRHLETCLMLDGSSPSPKACDCGALRAEGAIEDLRVALNELVSAVEDGRRRWLAGDPNGITSNLISATLRQAKEALQKSQ